MENRSFNGRSATTASTASRGRWPTRLDTLIINRRIEEARRPIPRMLKLGSLSDICRELGLSDSGKNSQPHQDIPCFRTPLLASRPKPHTG